MTAGRQPRPEDSRFRPEPRKLADISLSADDISGSESADEYFARNGFARSARPFDREQTLRRLEDIAAQGRICAQIVADGADAFWAPTFDALKTRMAATRSIEIVAEATAKLHSDFKEKFPGVGWRNLYRMRTLAAHHYDKVRDEIIWAAISQSVPQLVSALGLPESPEDPARPPED